MKAKLSDPALRGMPDIAAEGAAAVEGRLDWVGMRDMEMPVNVAVEGGVTPQASAKVSALVNLRRTDARGIHMSRLYLEVDRALAAAPLTPAGMLELLDRFLASHEALSDAALIRVDFDYLLRRAALASDHSGWRRYPVYVAAQRRGARSQVGMGAEVLYSSTCPCSAALARQLVQQNFDRDFGGAGEVEFAAVREWLGTERGLAATPHSQRSDARVDATLAAGDDLFPLLDLIDRVEGALATPVQAAVKREDEQAFARLNGENLMFCEDAARRLQHALNLEPRFLDWRARVAHRESLHPHDAVAEVCKGVPGGFSA